MPSAQFLFHGELNDLLPSAMRGKSITQTFQGSPGVKHVIEALGVPHTEVRSLTANGKPVDIGYQLNDGDQIEVFSGFEALADDEEPRFILDVHLGQLAAYLRMLGFDAKYDKEWDDPELAAIAEVEQRILLTRDRRLLMRGKVERGRCIRSLDSREQVMEVLQHFQLEGRVEPFRRCLRCNGELLPVDKDDVQEEIGPLTRQYYDEFRRCTSCGQVFWKGSHFDRMNGFIESLLDELQETS